MLPGILSIRPVGTHTATGTGRHGQLSLLKLSPSGYSNLNSATSRIVESMPMHGLKIDGKWGYLELDKLDGRVRVRLSTAKANQIQERVKVRI